MARAKPPTEKQLDYLRILGWNGPPPATLSDASALIDQLKAHRDAARAQRRRRRGCFLRFVGCLAMIFLASVAAFAALAYLRRQ